jgi:hypothetical protein
MSHYDPSRPGQYPAPRYLPPAPRKRMPLWAKIVAGVVAVPVVLIGGATALLVAGGAAETTGRAISPTYDPGINTPETKPAKSPKPTKQAPSLLPQDGVLLVGKDVKPGTYQTRVISDVISSCYWARLSDVDGSMASIIDNDLKTTVGAVMTLRVKSSDYAIEINCDGATWKRVG